MELKISLTAHIAAYVNTLAKMRDEAIEYTHLQLFQVDGCDCQ